jgi:hypothetical protein
VKHINEGKPLTEEIVKRLNGDRSLEELRNDIDEIGYPGGATKQRNGMYPTADTIVVMLR